MSHVRYGVVLTTFLSLAVACDSVPGEGSRSAAAPDTTRDAPVAGSGSDAPSGDARRRHSVYVPVYSHIYVGNRPDDFDLTVTLSIRNADPSLSLVVDRVTYMDSSGGVVREHLRTPRTLGPMASMDFHIGERDRTGGVGANFVVNWAGPETIVDPVVEAVMVGTGAGQGISFTSVGRPTRIVGDADTVSAQPR